MGLQHASCSSYYTEAGFHTYLNIIEALLTLPLTLFNYRLFYWFRGFSPKLGFFSDTLYLHGKSHRETVIPY
jgi:hypothetical protein